MSEDGFERICAICGTVVSMDSSSCRRCSYDVDAPVEDEQRPASRIRLDQPLASMRVYRRQIGTPLILFVFGFLLLAGGWVLAYFGGMWQLSAPEFVGGSSSAPLAIFTNYAQCGGLVESFQLLHPTLGSFAANASCSFSSLDSNGLTFVGLGGASILVGVVAFKKRFLNVGERIGAFWWALALAVPLFGGLVAYLGVREKNRASAMGLVLLGIETFFGSALLFILTGFPLSAF